MHLVPRGVSALEVSEITIYAGVGDTLVIAPGAVFYIIFFLTLTPVRMGTFSGAGKLCPVAILFHKRASESRAVRVPIR